jgi:hypothetical protein
LSSNRNDFFTVYEAPKFTSAGNNFRIFQFSHNNNNNYGIPRYSSGTTALRVLSTIRQHYTVSLAFKLELHLSEELIGCTREGSTHQFSEKVIPLDNVKFLGHCTFFKFSHFSGKYFQIIYKLLGADIC